MPGLISRAALVATSALLGVAAFPPWGCAALALIAWAPLLLALRGLRPGRAMLWGLGHGLLLYGGTLLWLCRIFGPGAAPMIAVLAASTALFAALYAAMRARPMHGLLRAIGAAVTWTGIEHFRAEWFALAFPWITPGTALPPTVLTTWIGTHGVSWCAILGAALLAESTWIASAAGVAVLGALASMLTWTSSTLVPPRDARIRVALVQGEGIGLERLLESSRRIDVPVDAIVWPELALSYDPRQHPRVATALQELLSECGAKLLVLGCRTGDLASGWRNTALFVGRKGFLGEHVKNRPVPFLDEGRRGVDVSVIATPIGRVAAPICFDLDASAVARRAVALGAELLLVPSQDPAWWGAAQHAQHAELARHRAAEIGRWIAVASSSGRTQVIDPSGARCASHPLFERGVLVAEVGLERERTPYVRCGWMLGPACTMLTALVAALLAFAAIHRSIVQRRT